MTKADVDYSVPLKNLKWETFVTEWVAGASKTDSFLAAYPHAQEWKPDTVWNRASKLSLRNEVRARYEALMEASAKRAEITKANVLSELAKLAFASVEDYVSIDEKGQANVDLKNVTSDQWAAVSEIQTDTILVVDKNTKRKIPKIKTKVKFYDKRKSLCDLGRAVGLFPSDKMRMELTGKDGGAIEVDTIDHLSLARSILDILSSAQLDGNSNQQVIEEIKAIGVTDDSAVSPAENTESLKLDDPDDDELDEPEKTDPPIEAEDPYPNAQANGPEPGEIDDERTFVGPFGAFIVFDELRHKYAVFDKREVLRGYRVDRARAMELARAIKK